jgi:hypothetical protein
MREWNHTNAYYLPESTKTRIRIAWEKEIARVGGASKLNTNTWIDEWLDENINLKFVDDGSEEWNGGGD